MIPEGYRALEDGTILGRRFGTPMKPRPNNYGYLQVQMWVDGKAKRFTVHVIVCEAFHGPRPTPKHQVRHLDGNKLNCRADNLKWGTAKENAADRKTHGTNNNGERHGNACLTWQVVHAIRQRYAAGSADQKDLAEEFGVSRATVSRVIAGKIWEDPDYTPPSEDGRARYGASRRKMLG